jgi:hypothetical protein
MMYNREFNEMCREIQKEFPDLTVAQISEMVKDAFEFAQKHISEGSLTPVYFQYLGRFRVKPGRKGWLDKQKKNDNIEREFPPERSTDSSPEEH